MRLIFVRHAEPDYAIDSLTEKGWREAALLADRVSRWDVDQFYCSPLGRARDTASLSLKKCKREAIICEWLREFAGTVKDPISGENRLSWDFLPAYWTKIDALHNVDTFLNSDLMKSNDVPEQYAWICRGIDEILASHGYLRDGKMYRTKEHKDETLVFFCHMGVTCYLLSHLINISPVSLIHGMEMAPSSVTIVTAEERIPGEAYFRCQTVGDTSHLYAAEEPVSEMGYFAEILKEEPKKDEI